MGKSLTLEEMRAEALARDARNLARLRDNYRLARGLGFTPQEAKRMQGWSQKRIIELAQEAQKRIILVGN